MQMHEDRHTPVTAPLYSWIARVSLFLEMPTIASLVPSTYKSSKASEFRASGHMSYILNSLKGRYPLQRVPHVGGTSQVEQDGGFCVEPFNISGWAAVALQG